VFVYVGEVSESGEGFNQAKGFGLYNVPMMVWLKPINSCSVYRAQFFESNGLSIPTLSIITDWKLKGAWVLDISASLVVSEAVNKIIESRSKVMNNVTQNKTCLPEVRDELVVVNAKIKNMLSGFRIEVMPDGCRLKGISYKFFESINVFQGPEIFSPCIVEGMMP
jgi:hypothetical protein